MDEAILAFKKAVQAVIKDPDIKFTLFGPKVDEVANADFDIKILIATKGDFGSMRSKVEDIEMEMVSSKGVLINSYLYTHGELERRKSEPFIASILENGVTI